MQYCCDGHVNNLNTKTKGLMSCWTKTKTEDEKTVFRLSRCNILSRDLILLQSTSYNKHRVLYSAASIISCKMYRSDQVINVKNLSV